MRFYETVFGRSFPPALLGPRDCTSRPEVYTLGYSEKLTCQNGKKRKRTRECLVGIAPQEDRGSREQIDRREVNLWDLRVRFKLKQGR